MAENSATYNTGIVEAFYDFIRAKNFPCIAARAAAAQQNICCTVAHDMSDNSGDRDLLQFLYSFIDEYRNSNAVYHSAALIFEGPLVLSEDAFESAFWSKLQSLSNMDAGQYAYDPHVSSDPASPHFSFSLKQEAFFVIAMHPNSSRQARRFAHPVLVFNPHRQFETLRENNHFDQMKEVVRKRDRQYSGSINPMLSDFGDASETFQYSGKAYDNNWQCPLHITHGKPDDNPAT